MAKRRIVLALATLLLAPLVALQSLANAGFPLGPASGWNGFFLADAALTRVEAAPPSGANLPEFIVREPGLEFATQAFAAEPLATNALFVLAVDARSGEDEEAGDRLTGLVTSLELRNPYLGVLRLRDALAGEEIESAFAVIDQLTTVNPDMAPALVTAFAPIVADPQSRDEMIGALEREPVWAEDFWIQSARNPALVEGLIDLRERVSAGTSPRTDEELLRGAINGELYAKAFSMWERITGAAPGSIGYLPGEDYAPVGWLFEQDARRSVNSTSSGGYAIYVARNANGEIGRQLVQLSPGDYVLEIEGDADIIPVLRSTVQCATRAGEPTIWRPGAEQTRFTIDGSCRIYWLMLGADTFDMRQDLDGSLSSVTFRRAR